MRDFSLIEKINMLMNIIISNPLFLFCSMIGVAVFIFYIISIKKDRKVNKWIFICVWIILLIILLFKYNKIPVTIDAIAIIKKLFELGVVASLNQRLEEDHIQLIGAEYGKEIVYQYISQFYLYLIFRFFIRFLVEK